MKLHAGVYSNSAQGVEAFAANVQSVCDLFRAASRRSNSSFASELVSKGVPAMADLISARMDKLMSQHQGLAVPDQAPTPGKKLKKGSSAEPSPGGSHEPTSSDEKAVNIVEDLARYIHNALIDADSLSTLAYGVGINTYVAVLHPLVHKGYS